MNGIVVIGASLGGLHALEAVLAPLPTDFPLPLLVVQHRAVDGGDLLTGLLRRHCRLEINEAEDKSELRPGRVLVGPAGYHVLVEPGHVELSTEAEAGFSTPSIDAAFETASRAYGSDAIGVVLTGMNNDGARGLSVLRRRGGTAIVQEPSSAEAEAMPAAAVATAAPQLVLPLEQIGERLTRLAAQETRK